MQLVLASQKLSAASNQLQPFNLPCSSITKLPALVLPYYPSVFQRRFIRIFKLLIPIRRWKGMRPFFTLMPGPLSSKVSNPSSVAFTSPRLGLSKDSAEAVCQLRERLCPSQIRPRNCTASSGPADKLPAWHSHPEAGRTSN